KRRGNPDQWWPACLGAQASLCEDHRALAVSDDGVLADREGRDDIAARILKNAGASLYGADDAALLLVILDRQLDEAFAARLVADGACAKIDLAGFCEAAIFIRLHHGIDRGGRILRKCGVTTGGNGRACINQHARAHLVFRRDSAFKGKLVAKFGHQALRRPSFVTWASTSSSAFSIASNISPICSSVMMRGGQKATMSPARPRTMRPCFWAAFTTAAPMPAAASKLRFEALSATSSTAPIRPFARAWPTSGRSPSRAMRPSKASCTERTWPTMLRFS